MYALQTLKMGSYHNVKNFNIPRVLKKNSGLRHLEIQVDHETSLQKEMDGQMPPKMRNITFSGVGLITFTSDLLQVTIFLINFLKNLKKNLNVLF